MARSLRALVVALLALCWLSPTNAHAHTATLSVLVVREHAPGRFLTNWEQTQGLKDPGAAYELLKPAFPTHCRFAAPNLDCGEQGLAGRVGFDGLGDLSTTGMLKLQWLDGRTQLVSLTAADPHVRISAGRHASTVTLASAYNFVGSGVMHIWLGWDHLLFVLGLLWFVASWRALLKTITAFTLAHSLTLAAASLGVFVLPGPAVEAVIALSIAFIAVEMVREVRSGRPSLTRQRPWLVAFGFGLLHGFGFASALSDLQLGRNELPIALLCFNLGVELGQLVFVAAMLALRPVWRRLELGFGPRFVLASQYAIGTVAMFWFFERIVAFLPQAS